MLSAGPAQADTPPIPLPASPQGLKAPVTLPSGAAVKALQKSRGLKQTGQMGPAEWKALDAAR